MTKTANSDVHDAPAAVREPRPFLYLEPARLPVHVDAKFRADCRYLEAAAGHCVPLIVRSLVDHTIALQNKRAIERGNPQPISMSVLNRRRRAARSWLLAVLAGKVDAETLHAFATQWMPTLAGTGPEAGKSAKWCRSIVEFVRGAVTACIFDEPSADLLPHAKALHVLETVLTAHLAASLHTAKIVAV
jgi:hypothetical protein